MYIKEFHIINFKAFKDVHISFNERLSILTGINNSGKTTVLEALALWHECFSKLIMQAGRGTGNYKKGQYVLGNTQVKYFPFEQINSVRCPNFDDLFHQKDRRLRIALSANLVNDDAETLNICFFISESGMNYKIELSDFTHYNFDKFNRFFNHLPAPFGFFYASPIAAILQVESFATQPKVTEAIVNRASASVLRNRLYALYRHPDISLFQRFLSDLSYVLSDNRRRIELFTQSDIQRDTNVVFECKTDPQDTPKDVALLGSGALQIIEILLNLYHSDNKNKDLNIILLDEPDSHIHRDIQSRLMKVLTQFSGNNQIFVTTHNEALIRSAELSNLFHLEAKSEGKYQNLNLAPLEKVRPRFSGIYPMPLKPLISALGAPDGLDFINAIESDVLLFVEGEDDARVFDVLLKQQTRPKKYAYWVLGGVSKVFDHITHYKTVLSNIKNKHTLWEKSVLVMDRDFLNDEHRNALPQALKDSIGLQTFLAEAYTFEATLLTDFSRFGRLLAKWLEIKGISADAVSLSAALEKSYRNRGKAHTAGWQDDKFIEETCYLYQNVREKLKTILQNKFIKDNDIQIGSLVRRHIEQCIQSEQYYKLMKKEDVEWIVNECITPTGIVFDTETDFIELMYCVDKSLWFDAWDFLNQI